MNELFNVGARWLATQISGLHVQCEAFAHCERPAVGKYHHPVIGFVPSCAECHARIGSGPLVELDELDEAAQLTARAARATRHRRDQARLFQSPPYFATARAAIEAASFDGWELDYCHGEATRGESTLELVHDSQLAPHPFYWTEVSAVSSELERLDDEADALVDELAELAAAIEADALVVELVELGEFVVAATEGWKRAVVIEDELDRLDERRRELIRRARAARSEEYGERGFGGSRHRAR